MASARSASSRVIRRTVRRITLDDVERAEQTLELLMGERVEPRKNWLIEAAGRIDQETIDA